MSKKCYRKYSGGLLDTSYVDVPCPNQTPSAAGFVGCCANSDACLADGLCAYNHTQPGGSGTYVQSCTDSSYHDIACPQHCTDQPRSDVVYNATNQVFACCSATADGGPDCANPTNETFFANPFWPLFISAQALATIGGQASPTSSAATISSTSSTTGPTCSSRASSLSTGAKAGIGVGFAIMALLLIASAVWMFFLLRSMKRLRVENGRLSVEKPPMFSPTPPDTLSVSRQPPNTYQTEFRAEMHNEIDRHRSELGQ